MFDKHFVIESIIVNKLIKLKKFTALVFGDKIWILPFFAQQTIITDGELTVKIFRSEFVREVFQIDLQSFKFWFRIELLLLTIFNYKIWNVLYEIHNFLVIFSSEFCVFDIKLIVFAITICKIILIELWVPFVLPIEGFPS